VAANALDAEKLQVLARWAAGLRTDEREELAAAGRAIELLIEEIERLHVLLWERQLYPDPAAPPDDGSVPAAETDGHPDVPADDDVAAAPRHRLLRRFHRESQSNT
jgi:hypothetical protein